MADIHSFLVRKSGVNYAASPSGSYIVQRANNAWEAEINFNDSSGLVTGIFAEEDEVEVYVDSVSAANKLLVGYVTKVGARRLPNRQKDELLHIVGWGDYLAAKTIFEKDYMKTQTGRQVLLDAAAEIAGLSTNITALNTAAENIKRNFNGTYVKDAFLDVVENVGADYFIDETKTLQAFLENARDLTESGTGSIYKVRDVPPATPDQLIVDHNHIYEFYKDAMTKYRTVVVTNGLIETFPVDIDFWTSNSLSYIHPEAGKQFSRIFTPFTEGAFLTHWSVDNTTIKPFEWFGAIDLGGGLTKPVIRLNIRDTTTDASTFLRGTDGEGLVHDLGLIVTDWQRIAFVIKNGLTGATVNSIKMRLYSAPVGANYWERDILSDLNGSNYTYIHYALPANTTDAVSNGWTKNGSPTKIDAIYFEFRNGAGLIDGYAASSFVEFAFPHFFRRQRATVTGAGSPATEKIIIDASAKNSTALSTLATKEQARANVTANLGEFTILGNQAFKKPAHRIQVDFTNTLGSGRSGTVRIDEIKHWLQDSRYYTTVKFGNSFLRP